MALPGRKRTEDRPNVADHGRRLGARIKEARDARSLSRTEVSFESAVSPQQLANVETGKVGDPGFLLIGRIAEKLGLDLGYLYRIASDRDGGQP